MVYVVIKKPGKKWSVYDAGVTTCRNGQNKAKRNGWEFDDCYDTYSDCRSAARELNEKKEEEEKEEKEPEPEKRYRAICYENSTGNKGWGSWGTKARAREVRDYWKDERADTHFDFGYEKEGSEKAGWKEPPKPEEKHNRVYGVVKGNLNLSLAFVTVKFGTKTVTTLSDGKYEFKDVFYSGKITATCFGYIDYESYIEAPVEGELEHNIGLTQEEPEPEPEPEEPDKTWLDIIYGLPKIIFALTNPIPIALSGLIPDEWKVKVLDFVLPINSLSKLILHKSIYEGESGEMTEFDYIDLAMGVLIFAGGAGLLSKLGTKLGVKVAEKAVVRGVVGAVEKGTPKSFRLYEESLKIPGIAKELTEEFVKNPALTTKLATKSPGAMKGIFGTLLSQAKANPLLAAMVIMQIDILAWGFGLSPLHARGKVLDVIKQMRVDMIRLDGLIKTAKTDSDWKEIKKLLDQIKNESSIARRESKSAPAELYKAFGFTLDDVIGMLDAIDISIIAYKEKYPQLKDEIEPVVIITKEIIASKLKEEFTITNFIVEDGDTIDWPDNPLAGYLRVFQDIRIPSAVCDTKIRFLGIDTHESGTVAGKKEMKYLKSLIDGKTITIKINEYFDPERVIGRYGRLLAGIFVDGEDVMVKMLEKFGKDILTETKYQKKYRWIDWDYYKRVSKGETIKAKIKIYSKPSYCNIFIDDKPTHKLTIETFELEPGEYKFIISKLGYVEQSETIELKAGDELEKRFELKKTDEVGEEEEIEEREKFSIYIDSIPSNAKLFIDGRYTHHLTPSDEKELSDVIALFSPGKHEIKVTRKGLIAVIEVDIVAGKNEDIILELGRLEEEEEGIPPEEEKPEEEEEKEVEEIPELILNIDTNPTHAKIYIDGVYTHHLTPSDEKELSDVKYLLKPGKHKFRFTRSGLGAEQIRDIPKIGTVTIFSNLVIMGLPSEEEEEKEETTNEKIARLRAEIEELQKELDLLSLM